MRDAKIKELKLQVETAREGEAKSTALVATFQQRLAEFEASHGTLEGAASRSELAVQTLTKQNAELQERILDLEARARYVYFWIWIFFFFFVEFNNSRICSAQ